MKTPLQVTLCDVERSEQLDRCIHACAAGLDRLAPYVSSCHVTIGPRYRHYRQGVLYSVAVALRVGDRDLVVARERSASHGYQDLEVALRTCFDAVEQQVQEQLSTVIDPRPSRGVDAQLGKSPV